MRVNLRIEYQTPKYVKFKVFINGENSGTLVMSSAEYNEFAALLLAGAKDTDNVVWAAPPTLEMFEGETRA